MSIHYKFRSLKSFDFVDTDGRPSISLRELRLKIMRHNKIRSCDNFDLIFSDALSGQVYNDENFQIVSGSSVIVKRVPAGTMPSTAKFQCQNINSSDLGQAIRRGSNYINVATKLPEPKTVDEPTLRKVVGSDFPDFPHSPSASGKGSNDVLAETFYDSLIGKESLSRTMQQMDGGRGQYANHWNFPSVPDDPEDCQGESKPFNLLHAHAQGEGMDMHFMPAGRVKKDRNCYMCGSPDHLIRDCTFASNPNPMLQTGNAMLTGGFPGYPSAYWNCSTYSTPSPFANMYGNAGNAPFNAFMVPPTPFAPYTQSMHGVPLPGGIIRMGGMALPAGNRDDLLPLTHYEHMGLQLAEDKRRIQNEKMEREHCQAESNFKEHYPRNDREASGKFHKESEPGRSGSGDIFVRKTHRKNHHVEKRRERSPHSSSASRGNVPRHSDRSYSASYGFPSSSDRRRTGSHQHHSRDSRKRHECDSTLGRYQVSDRRRGVNCHVRCSHQKHHRSSAREPSSHVHQKAPSKERGFGYDANYSRHPVRHSIYEVRDNKKQMSSDTYEDCRGSYHHKRKRVH